jgi:hypothetical protein
MPTFTTWNDLLFPSGQDASIKMSRFNDIAGPVPAKNSTLCFLEWNPNRLPSRVHLAQGLTSKMHRDLRRIIDENCPASANSGQFTDDYHTNGVTPDHLWSSLQWTCTGIVVGVNNERSVEAIAMDVPPMAHKIYRALTGETLLTDLEVETDDGLLIDQASIMEDEVKILWENKSPKVFDNFIRDLMDEIRGSEKGIEPYHHHAPTRYSGYQAILCKVCTVSSAMIYYLSLLRL